MKKLFGQRVLAKVIDEDVKTDSGLYLVNKDPGRIRKAEVLMIGPGTDEVKMEVVPGDIIDYDVNTVTKLKYDNSDAIIVKMQDIIGVN